MNNQSRSYTSTGYLQILAPQGWQCPLCKKIYAPHISECYCCNNYESTLTNKVEPSWTITTTNTKEETWKDVPGISSDGKRYK